MYAFDGGEAAHELLRRGRGRSWLLGAEAFARDPIMQFALGGPCSGAPWHYHEDAVNVLGHGARAWRLLPPASAMLSRTPAAVEWGAAPRGAEVACLQRGGDALFVPAGWGHTTLNLQESAGFAVELRPSS